MSKPKACVVKVAAGLDRISAMKEAWPLAKAKGKENFEKFKYSVKTGWAVFV